MKILLAIGSHPRHFYIAKRMAETGCVAATIIEDRGALVPSPTAGLNGHLAELFVRHFEDRERAETIFFGANVAPPPGVPCITVNRGGLNGPELWELLRETQVDTVVSYGVGKFTDDTLARLPERKWNIHAGLSPWYRGVITHFWPSYMLEPQMTGMTLHELTNQLDGGAIVHQLAAPLVKGDGLHDLACRAVNLFGEELIDLLQCAAAGGLAPSEPQRTQGKLWTVRDWHPAHLAMIYDVYGNRIVDAYLEGRLRKFQPKLVRQVGVSATTVQGASRDPVSS